MSRDADAAPVVGAMRALWRLRWDNGYKEVYWRLALDGLATAARMHMPSESCLCGHLCPGRLHHFWQCPVAVAVVREVLAGLPPAWCTRPVGGPPALACSHVWLMTPPRGRRRVCAGVWRVVCLAALVAMDEGRRATNGWRLALRVEGERRADAAAPAPVPAGQQRVTDLWRRRQGPLGPAPLTLDQQAAVAAREERRQRRGDADRERRLHVAQLRAVGRFYALLADFVAVGAAPPEWGASPGTEGRLPDDHPFVRPRAGGGLQLVPPPGGTAAASAAGGGAA